MFYLNEFIKIIRNHFFMSSIFILSIVGMMLTLGQKEVINKKVALFQKSNMNSYFNALVIGSSNIDGVKRKMKNLPGVTNVMVSGANSLSREIKHLKSSFGEDAIGKLAALNYKKVKIELDETINLKNQTLIKEYLKRLIGKENITLGAVKKPRGLKLNKKDPLYIILNYLEYYLFSICFFLFVVSTYVLSRYIHGQAYIIQKFQRKDRVGFKISIMGALIILMIGLIFNFLMGQRLNPILFVPVVLTIIVVSLFNIKDILTQRVR